MDVVAIPKIVGARRWLEFLTVRDACCDHYQWSSQSLKGQESTCGTGKATLRTWSRGMGGRLIPLWPVLGNHFVSGGCQAESFDFNSKSAGPGVVYHVLLQSESRARIQPNQDSDRRKLAGYLKVEFGLLKMNPKKQRLTPNRKASLVPCF